jgi:hypothetical protein
VLAQSCDVRGVRCRGLSGTLGGCAAKPAAERHLERALAQAQKLGLYDQRADPHTVAHRLKATMSYDAASASRNASSSGSSIE